MTPDETPADNEPPRAATAPGGPRLATPRPGPTPPSAADVPLDDETFDPDPELGGLPEGARYHRLRPEIRTAWRLGHAIWTVPIAAAFAVLDVMRLTPLAEHVPLGVASLVGALPAVFFVGVYPELAYRRFRYALRDWDVLVCKGVIWQSRRSMPRMRIQHVDVASGPIDRWLGLATLTAYTAGTGDADAALPGLSPDRAEVLRRVLLPTERVDV